MSRRAGRATANGGSGPGALVGLTAISMPVLVLHGDDDLIVPYQNASVLSAKLLRNGTLKIYPGLPHGMLTTHADALNADLLAFVES